MKSRAMRLRDVSQQESEAALVLAILGIRDLLTAALPRVLAQ